MEVSAGDMMVEHWLMQYSLAMAMDSIHIGC